MNKHHNGTLPLDDITYDTSIYPREAWKTSTVDRYVDELKRREMFITTIANALLYCGSVKKIAPLLRCAQSYIYDHISGKEFLYFFLHETRVKIGYTGSLIQRVSSYRPYKSDRSLFVAVCHGTKKEEKALHAFLKAYNIHGEWFKAEALDVLADFSPVSREGGSHA